MFLHQPQADAENQPTARPTWPRVSETRVKDSLRVEQHHIAPNTPRLKSPSAIFKKPYSRGVYRVTPQNRCRRFKMQRGARTARVSRITSNRNSVIKPQPLHPRPPRRLRRHCRAERRQAGRRPQHHSGRKSGYRSNQRGPTRSSESSRSRLQCPCTEPSRSYSTGR